MDFKIPQALRPALVVVASLVFPIAASAAVPSGATTSPVALRQAYIDVVKSRNPAVFEALFDMTMMPPATRAAFVKHISDDLGHKISDVTLKDPEPGLKAEYAQAHAYFPMPVIKTLKVAFISAPNQIDGVEYYVGSSAGRYYFVSAVQVGK